MKWIKAEAKSFVEKVNPPHNEREKTMQLGHFFQAE